ncbi:GSCFA family protein [Chitinophaga costaii]|uniref:GSCFA family protein n=1 Tax=Chitinophaga costaii TaxID=1335309 RepID=A0A1C3YW48_9BACT|nr:GSCFA domain-containing protein [Chitinophaga costaii]SCB74252.1 GSCFA family protein [Chitinophaga costaii]
MNFRLTFPVAPLSPSLRYSDRFLLLGSCFAEEIGDLLQQHKFQVLQNPHGILYNPLSITQALQSYLDGKVYTADDLFQQDDLWHSWAHHSRFSAATPEAALDKINVAQQAAIHRIENADWLIITLGTAFGYQLRESGRLVANCHKAPAHTFNKKLLSVEEIITSLDNVMHRLFFRNRQVRILFTVSPVRHVRDGVVENNLSKAILLQAVHHMVHKFERLHYFPAYELVIDDLRDYRFYKEDLVHPNEMAVQYVWEQFCKYALAPAELALLHAVQELRQAAAHRPFNPATPQHQQFLARYAQKTGALQAAHPFLDLSSEAAYFNTKEHRK